MFSNVKMLNKEVSFSRKRWQSVNCWRSTEAMKPFSFKDQLKFIKFILNFTVIWYVETKIQRWPGRDFFFLRHHQECQSLYIWTFKLRGNTCKFELGILGFFLPSQWCSCYVTVQKILLPISGTQLEYENPTRAYTDKCNRLLRYLLKSCCGALFSACWMEQ